jgi:hypothetical protein
MATIDPTSLPKRSRGPCIMTTRLLFLPIDSEPLKVSRQVPSWVNPLSFETLRRRYHFVRGGGGGQYQGFQQRGHHRTHQHEDSRNAARVRGSKRGCLSTYSVLCLTCLWRIFLLESSEQHVSYQSHTHTHPIVWWQFLPTPVFSAVVAACYVIILSWWLAGRALNRDSNSNNCPLITDRDIWAT